MQLRHSNIVKYIACQESQIKNEVDIIYEYCVGGSIKQILDKFSSFEEKLISKYAKQVLDGLVYLHDRGISHRNIKSSNILIDGKGVAKLSDFIASNLLIGDDPDQILAHCTLNGKDYPFNVAPEIIKKEQKTDQSVDIWSLGCVIIEMATKKNLYGKIYLNQ